MLLSHLFNVLSQVCFQWYRARKPLLVLTIALPILVFSSGCQPNFKQIGSTFFPPALELTIDQVEPTSQPGVYSVSGRATLPDSTRITVSAVRYLQPNLRLSAAESPPYVILDRQFAEVNQDSWQTRVNLWQVATDGRYQEAWQINSQTAGVDYEPSPAVTFLATLDPIAQPKDLQTRVEQLDEDAQAALMQFTTDGELYVQASQNFDISLPTGSTVPPPDASSTRTSRAPVDVTPRSPEATTAESWHQTTAPLPAGHTLR
jgi:hypothetical protein